MDTSNVSSFLDELDNLKLVDQGDRASRTANTKTLLEGADKLLKDSKILSGKIADKTLRPGICGYTYIDETFDGVTHQRAVIDLVQQGGTMLGIGLLGYTYIMERAGIRFRSMAGTSAGAINTLLVAALPEDIYKEHSPFDETRQAVKSEFLAYLVANKDFSKFLDRRGIIGWVQCRLLKRITGISRILPVLKIIFPLAMLVLAYVLYFLLNHFLFNSAHHLTENQINIYNFITGTLIIASIVLMVLIFVFGLFKNKMGVNPGRLPYDWMKGILETEFVHIRTTQDLIDKKKKEPQPVFPPDENGKPSVVKDPRIVFITANLTHNRIVKFPENNADYWNKNYADQVSPAAYVRASMSLPFIFYAFIPDDHYVQGGSGERGSKYVDMLARFIDGGMLSNFPIREFHVQPPEIPFYPTFGVLLGSPPVEPGQDTEAIRKKFFSLSVFKFIISFISTFRRFYDADFLRSHKEFSMLVRSVNTDRFNSLDFGMKFQTKQDIFMEGAKTAITQLENFDWKQYLVVRLGMTAQTNKPPIP